jgi:hypothetical protein
VERLKDAHLSTHGYEIADLGGEYWKAHSELKLFSLAKSGVERRGEGIGGITSQIY